MRIHPLSASPATNAFFQTGTNLTDDVTTIFVVGFPDDMTEREFQNMFTFCPGFEAASLKWHCKDQEDDNSVGSNGGKKQMIGFARFRTRLEAMEAVEVLGGKKIDQEKGTVLKAEMAKKNLHVKRGSVAPTTNTFLPSTPTTQQTLLSKKLGRQHGTTSSGSYDAFSPLPSDLLSPADYKTDPFMNDPFTCSTPTTPIFSDALFGNLRSNSFDGRQPDIGLMSPPRHFGNGIGIGNASSTNTNSNGILGFNQGQTNNLTDLRSPSISSIHRPSNPADQNPPCNTLYVGNLPPNTNEDELRQLFSQCRGYKRMCFRNKPQGPMCFVEFEDVVLATNALNEYQGHCLTTSAKGGIRLSFSKNPLFIKGPGGTPMNQNNSGDSNNKGGNNKNSINNGKIGVSSTDQQL
ncbi:uncharacterized protein BX664DRAFT_258563 [Halteromyces radiatus]|uniref:uncharacterized protein n=1 Tax=Halteromyces radiatus TaxID=101107 RepID=UPI00221F5DC1|nr:uncharacterized protein BX664DRAFT_258563 [Halteromyces radiatus]KAI8096753.1 hypothetical protein BX664DRAFT_258563 [Halteromyces radiatus]